MNAQDIYSLLIGYGICCVGIYAFVMLTIRKIEPDMQIPFWFWCEVAGIAIFPIVNIVMLIKTINVRRLGDI